jgi:hypothetical protein
MIQSNETDLLIHLLLLELSHSVDTAATEVKIREHFEELMNDEDLLMIPISVLHRVINYDIGVSLFAFLMKCLYNIGSSASVLFDKFDISQLDSEQLEALESNTDFN